MKRLLIIEDFEGLREGYIDALSVISKEELIIDEAVSSSEAINLMKKTNYDYIILDGQLVGSHGREVLLTIKDSDKQKVFVYSGDMTFLSTASKAGFYAKTKNSDFREGWNGFISQLDQK